MKKRIFGLGCGLPPPDLFAGWLAIFLKKGGGITNPPPLVNLQCASYFAGLLALCHQA